MSGILDDEDFTLEDEWVEISDTKGHTASLRHVATIRFGERTYSVLSAMREDDQLALMLVREEQTVDGASEYVLVGDEQEAEQVVERFVSHIVTEHLLDAITEGDQEDEVEACGCRHRAGEFCYCDDPQYLQ